MALLLVMSVADIGNESDGYRLTVGGYSGGSR